MKMRVYKNLTDQCDILNSWDLMHIMRQIDNNARRKRNLEKMPSRKVKNDFQNDLPFHP